MRTFSWVRNLPAIMDRLKRHVPGPITRMDIVTLFSVGRARAIELIHQFGGTAGPEGLTVDRDRLLAHLEELARSGDLRLNVERQEAIEAKLEPYRKMLGTPYARFPVPAGSATYGTRFQSLPAGIHFETGKLVIDHDGLEDLLGKLFALSQALSNDLDTFAGQIDARTN